MKSAFVRFVFVGVLGFVVDAGLVVVLIGAGLSPVIARIPALTAAILTTWFLNRTLTFRVQTPRTREELGRYVAVALSSAGLTFVLYSALVLMGMWPVAGVALSTVCPDVL